MLFSKISLNLILFFVEWMRYFSLKFYYNPSKFEGDAVFPKLFGLTEAVDGARQHEGVPQYHLEVLPFSRETGGLRAHTLNPWKNVETLLV